MTCHREEELLDSLGAGFVGAELEEHVASCASCRELSLVAGALLDDRAEAIAEAPVPAAGTMWWRMRVRHRQEIESTARRSLLIGQAATLAIALTLVISLFGTEVVTGVRGWIETIRLSTPLLLAVATSLLLLPLAGYVAVRRSETPKAPRESRPAAR